MMMTGTLLKRIAVLLAFAVAGAVSAQGQIMYAGPGTIVQQQFWNPQVYGYNTYPYLAPGPYAYSFITPPGGAIMTPQGYVLRPPGPVPQPFTYGYPPGFYPSPIPRLYGPPPGRYRGYQPGPNRPRFVNPYDPPVPQPQGIDMRDSVTPPQKQGGATVTAERGGRTDAMDELDRRASDRTKRPQPPGHVTPADGSQDRPVPQGERPAAGQESEGTAAPADPNEPAK